MHTALLDGPLDDAWSNPRRLFADDVGAVVSFLGTVRNEHLGKGVTHLVYDAHRSMAEGMLRHIASQLQQSCAQRVTVAIAHGLGHMLPCDISIAIHVCSPHRELAYQLNREAIEWIKRDLPVWKKEFYTDGSSAWLHGS